MITTKDAVDMLAKLQVLYDATDLCNAKPIMCTAESRHEMKKELAASKWLDGPYSDNQEFYAVNAERNGEAVSVCMVGNGPTRRETSNLISTAINNLPTLINLALDGLEMRSMKKAVGGFSTIGGTNYVVFADGSIKEALR